LVEGHRSGVQVTEERRVAALSDPKFTQANLKLLEEAFARCSASFVIHRVAHQSRV